GWVGQSPVLVWMEIRHPIRGLEVGFGVEGQVSILSYGSSARVGQLLGLGLGSTSVWVEGPRRGVGRFGSQISPTLSFLSHRSRSGSQSRVLVWFNF
uniref:Uncharacterized protein n=1 Tax=Cannabis sativa TaxID=3483 RepID=A0A803P585_CANSA